MIYLVIAAVICIGFTAADALLVFTAGAVSTLAIMLSGLLHALLTALLLWRLVDCFTSEHSEDDSGTGQDMCGIDWES